MDNAQKAIMIGVGLFITIIIISAVLLIVNLGTGLVDDATAELGSMSTTLQNQILQNYDGKTISGTQVRAAFQQYANDTSLCVIMVKNVDSTATTINTDITLASTPLKITMGTGAKAITGITGTVGGTVKLTADSNLTDFGSSSYVKATASDWTNSLESDTYINTAKNYDASVIRNATDTIVGIVFQLAD